MHTEQMHLVGRMHDAGWYAKTNEFFQILRLTFEEWKSKRGDGQ